MNKVIHIRDIIVSPQSVKNWQLKDWDLLVQQAYSTGQLARIYHILSLYSLEDYIPHDVKWHLVSANKVYLAHKLDITNEIKRLNKVLNLGGIFPVYLKGAAYVAEEDICSLGRMFVDVDLFVKEENIKAAEQILKWQGWEGKELNKHDEKYYRMWMHEIPPMVNINSGLTVDIHHSLMPLTSRIPFNKKAFIDGATKRISEGKLTLSKEDRLLHSALHLFLDGEFNKGFRDLCDMHFMLNEFSEKDDMFWQKIIQRAEELGVSRVLYYCLVHTSKLFNTNIPEEVLEKVKKFKGMFITDWLTNLCFSAVLIPNHESCRGKFQLLATQALFLRGHWLKMPLHILVPHLLYKSFITPYIEWKKSKTQPIGLNG